MTEIYDLHVPQRVWGCLQIRNIQNTATVRKSETKTHKKKLNISELQAVVSTGINIKFTFKLWRSQVESILINWERTALIREKKVFFFSN